MNMLFTDFCDRSCPYCFASGKVGLKRSSSGYLDLKDLRQIIAFLKRSGENDVGILGGEPTLHPEFKKAVAMVVDAGLRVNVFSHGLIEKDTAVFLKGLGADKCSVTLNVNSPESYAKSEWGKLSRVLKLLNNKQVKLGFTVYRPDFNMDFMAELIERYSLDKRIRLGIAVPTCGGNNGYLSLSEYSMVSAKIVDFAEKHCLNGIVLVFDCGFTMCSFTDSQLGRLVRSRTAFHFSCVPIIDVAPGLKIWSCFATSNMWNKNLTDFNDLSEVTDFYRKKFFALRRIGARRECFRCRFMRMGNCSGGCLGHTLKLCLGNPAGRHPG